MSTRQMKKCPLCRTEKSVEEFKDKRFYHEHQVCMDCCTKASRRIKLLTKFDVEICEKLDLDYALLNCKKGKFFDDQLMETEA